MPDYTLSAKITGDSSGIKNAISIAQNAVEGFSKKMDSVSQKIESAGRAFAPVSAAVAGVGIASGKMALDFEDSMANVNTLLDDPSHLQGYEDTVKKISNDTGLSLDSMSAGMYQAISSLGDGGKETESIFNTMARSAKAGGAEVSDSVSLISAGMKGYNQVNGETAQRISDLAFQTAKLGVTTFPEMAKSMQPLFPLSNSLNISYEELFGSMATLTGVTGNTAEVSTQLKAVFSNLMSPTESMQKMIEKYGYSSGQAMLESEGLAGTLKLVQDETGGQADKMAELFSSTEAVTAMTALTGSQFDNFNTKLGEMSNAAGTTDTAYEKMNTNGDKLRRTWNQIKNSGVELGSTMIDMIAPSIETVGNAVSGFTTWFSSADDSVKRTIITVGALVAGFTPALLMVGKIAKGVSLLGQGLGLLLSPVGLVIAAVLALAAGIVYMSAKNESFREKILSAWESIKTTVSGIVNALGPIISSIFDGLVTAAQNIGPTLSTIFGVIQQVMGILIDAFGVFFSGLSDGFSSGLANAGGFQTGLMSIIGLICPPLKAVLFIFQNFGPQIQSLVSVIGSSLVPVFSTLGTTIGGIASAVLPAIQSAIMNLMPVIVQIIDTVLQVVNTVLPVVVSLINQLAPFLVQIAEVLGQIFAALAPIIAQLIGSLLPVIANIITVVMNVIQSIMPALISILNVVMSVIQALVPVIMDIISVVASVISNVISVISPIISFIGAVISAIMAVITPIVSFVGNIIAVIISVIGTLIGTITGIFSTVYGIVSGVFSNISGFISGVINTISSIISTLTGIVGGVFNSIYSVISSIMGKVKSFITGVFNGIKTAWNGLTSFVSGVFSGIGSAVSALVSTVKGFVNGVIGGINAAIGLINLIPGVNIGRIPYLAHGTDNWQGGFAYMNEGGRGELTYLPNGSQVIPHDISVQYAKESARANAAAEPIDMSGFMEGMAIQIVNNTSVDGTPLKETVSDYTIRKIGNQQKAVLRVRGAY